MQSESSRREYAARINRVIAYVNGDLSGDCSLEALARIGCFSPFHFHRIFSAVVGETPLEFVQRVRLEKSAMLLTYGAAESIASVALSCGFSSPAAFSRAFRARFGIPPSAWRTRRNRKTGKAVRKSGKALSPSALYVRVSDKRHNHRTGRNTPMDVSIRELPARRVAYVANLGGYDSSKIGAAWDRLCSWAGPLDLLAPPTEFIGISFDDPAVTPKDRCRYYACITVPEEIVPPAGVGVLAIRAGRHAVMRYDGPLSGIAGAYARLYGEWLPASGHQPGEEPAYEVYFNTPEDDPEGKIVMDICIPLKPLWPAGGRE